MSGVGPGAVLLSQTPDDNYRRLNDLRVTDLYVTNIVQPVYDIKPGQLERLPIEQLLGSQVTIPAGSQTTLLVTVPEDAYVLLLGATLGTPPAGAPVGTVTVVQSYIGTPAAIYRWFSGTVTGFGRDGFADSYGVNFDDPIFCRSFDVVGVTVRNTSAGALTNAQAFASIRRIQP